MNNHAEELDRAIEAAGSGGTINADSEMNELAQIALDLKTIADTDFREQLKAELLDGARGPFAEGAITREIPSHVEPRSSILPTLSGIGYDNYPVNQRSFAASLAAHVTALALVVASGVWAANHERLQPRVTTRIVLGSDYMLPAGAKEAHGGGGSGNHEKLPSSHGQPPRFSAEQLAPPTVLVPRESKLLVEPTVVGPPNVTFPVDRLGDPLSAALMPSNGPGSGGAIGNRHGTGVGDGDGLGVGRGSRAGIGGGPYSPGMGGVSAPRAIYDPEPEYSDEARKAKFQGNVLLWVVVGTDGRARDIRVQRSLGMGLDQKAIDTVKTWRFSPAMKDGQPVAVQVNIEVNFRLF
jgi:TonB family protein